MVYVSLVDTEKTIQKNEIDNIIDVDGIVWYYTTVWCGTSERHSFIIFYIQKQ